MARRVALICLLAAVAGCGGGNDDEEEARQTVRDFVAAVRDSDADKFCEELVTQEFLEQTIGSSGSKAQESCKRELNALSGVRVRLVRIGKTTVDEDRARVAAVLARSGQELRQTFRLKKEDGDWRLAGSGE